MKKSSFWMILLLAGCSVFTPGKASAQWGQAPPASGVRYTDYSGSRQYVDGPGVAAYPNPPAYQTTGYQTTGSNDFGRNSYYAESSYPEAAPRQMVSYFNVQGQPVSYPLAGQNGYAPMPPNYPPPYCGQEPCYPPPYGGPQGMPAPCCLEGRCEHLHPGYNSPDQMPEGGLITGKLNSSPDMQCGSAILGPGAFFIDGYIDQGLTWGTSGRENYPQVMNDRGNGYQMNQLYLSFGRAILRQNCWAVGGQVDLMFGTDYYYLQSRGLEATRWGTPRWNGETNRMLASRGWSNEYGAAMPQAFFEVYSPWLNGISVKLGHFYSPMGYESMMAPNNFFYSHSYMSIYGMPATMTGVMTTTRLTPGMNLVLGAVNGWNGSETVNNDFSFVGGLTFDSCDQRFSISALVMTGKQDLGLYGGNRLGRYIKPFPATMDDTMVTVFDLQAKWHISPCLTYAVDFVAGSGKRYIWNPLPNKENVSWFGLSNYLFYQINECWAVGTRFEWFNDAKDSMVIGTDTGESVNYFAWTVGAKWTPVNWLTIRPEVRWDHCDYKQNVGAFTFRAYDEGTSSSQFTVGADMIIRF